MASDYYERMAHYDWVVRQAKLAKTYLLKVEQTLDTKDLNTYHWDLLDQALSTATDIVEKLPDEFFVSEKIQDHFGLLSALGTPDDYDKFNSSDAPLEAAEKLVALLKERRAKVDVLRKIRQMENTTGRTPAEAEAFRRSAAALRERYGLGARNG